MFKVELKEMPYEILKQLQEADLETRTDMLHG
jgi:hypothetical protein